MRKSAFCRQTVETMLPTYIYLLETVKWSRIESRVASRCGSCSHFQKHQLDLKLFPSIGLNNNLGGHIISQPFDVMLIINSNELFMLCYCFV